MGREEHWDRVALRNENRITCNGGKHVQVRSGVLASRRKRRRPRRRAHRGACSVTCSRLHGSFATRSFAMASQRRIVPPRKRCSATCSCTFCRRASIAIRCRFGQHWDWASLRWCCSFLLVLTGIALMVYYKPSTDQAYDSMKEIRYVVPTGRFMRNIHRWAAHAMVACVILHMARAFYTAAYKAPRQFNWVVGMMLFVLTLGLSFTGYLLPWDQLAYWAVTIGSEIAHSPREVTDPLGMTSWFDVGGFFKRLLLGANEVGQEALIRFYLLHVMVLPLLTAVLLAVHFWRVRKDGGLTRPAGADQMPPQTEGSRPETSPSKTYGLMAVVRGKTPRSIEAWSTRFRPIPMHCMPSPP